MQCCLHSTTTAITNANAFKNAMKRKTNLNFTMRLNWHNCNAFCFGGTFIATGFDKNRSHITVRSLLWLCAEKGWPQKFNQYWQHFLPRDMTFRQCAWSRCCNTCIPCAKITLPYSEPGRRPAERPHDNFIVEPREIAVKQDIPLCLCCAPACSDHLCFPQ